MTYSIGDVVDITRLHWSSDWDFEDIFGEDCKREGAIGLYGEKENDTMYYIDLNNSVVIAVLFPEIDGEEDTEKIIWNEEYFKC